ncbi:hypothetical protein, partial [Beijerinckia sp. L45]|uniref:hypothetical protein n=1 Tax=Beijerinckia sp. L45 TaxID=1641855 RepID=UPI00131A937D
ISDILAGGGWVEKDWKDQTAMILRRDNRPGIGLANISGITVAADIGAGFVTHHAVAELSAAIKGKNFESISIVGKLTNNHNGNAIIITVGQKKYD